MQSHNGINIGDTVVVVKSDPMDDRIGTPIGSRWNIGEEFVVGRISSMFGYVFFHDITKDECNIDSRRVDAV